MHGDLLLTFGCELMYVCYHVRQASNHSRTVLLESLTLEAIHCDKDAIDFFSVTCVLLRSSRFLGSGIASRKEEKQEEREGGGGGVIG